MLWILTLILGGLCLLVVLALAGLVAFSYFVLQRVERQVRREGQPVVAALVMANSTLADPEGERQTAGVVLFSFEPPSPERAAWLRSLAADVYRLYQTHDVSRLSPSEQEVAAAIKADRYTQGRRTQLPSSFTGGRNAYLADLRIHRYSLPPNWNESQILACMATQTDGSPGKGNIILLNADEAEAQRMYRAAE